MTYPYRYKSVKIQLLELYLKKNKLPKILIVVHVIGIVVYKMSGSGTFPTNL